MASESPDPFRISVGPLGDPDWSDSDSNSLRGSDSPDGSDPLTLDLDLFRRRSHLLSPVSAFDPSEFRVFDRSDDMESNFLGLGFGDRELSGGWDADDFFIGRRLGVSESTEFARARPVDRDGLRILGFESDSDSDERQIVAIGENSGEIGVQDHENSLPLCWDCLRIEDDRINPNDEFEWEEIDGRIEDRDGLSMMVIGTEGNSNLNSSSTNPIQESEYQEEDMERNIEWEVLLTVNPLGNSSEDAESYFVDDQEGFVYTSEYDEVLFGQFQEHDSSIKGGPPAAKSVVENLPSVVLTKEDVDKNNTNCAVCKDEIFIEEKAKRLPCSHYYHKECILPWLGIRNTCPLCRYELPTDDLEYENQKARRAGAGNAGIVGLIEEARVRYDFEMLHEA